MPFDFGNDKRLMVKIGMKRKIEKKEVDRDTKKKEIK